MSERAKRKAPAFQWYPGDHQRDTAVKACSLEARGLWREMLDLMHDGEPYGHLTAGGMPIDTEQLARIVGISAAKARALMGQLEERKVFSRSDAGVIYSRRMVRDEHNRQVRGAGGVKSLDNPNVPRPKDSTKDSTKDHRKDTPKDTFAPSFEGSPAVAVAVASAVRTTNTAAAPPVQGDRGELWTLIRSELYAPDGKPPDEWDEARDGSILSALLKRRNAGEVSQAIQGIALLRDFPGQYGEVVDWLPPPRGKLTLRALYHSRSGVRDSFALATEAYWKHVERRPKERARGLESVASLLQLAATATSHDAR